MQLEAADAFDGNFTNFPRAEFIPLLSLENDMDGEAGIGLAPGPDCLKDLRPLKSSMKERM